MKKVAQALPGTVDEKIEGNLDVINLFCQGVDPLYILFVEALVQRRERRTGKAIRREDKRIGPPL